jgi:hypothetical protein
MRPLRAGRTAGTIGLDGGPDVQISQFVYP